MVAIGIRAFHDTFSTFGFRLDRRSFNGGTPAREKGSSARGARISLINHAAIRRRPRYGALHGPRRATRLHRPTVKCMERKMRMPLLLIGIIVLAARLFFMAQGAVYIRWPAE